METEVAKTKATENKHERDFFFFYFFGLLNLSFLFIVTQLQQKQL